LTETFCSTTLICLHTFTDHLTAIQRGWIFCCSTTWRIYLVTRQICGKWRICWDHCEFHQSLGYAHASKKVSF